MKHHESPPIFEKKRMTHGPSHGSKPMAQPPWSYDRRCSPRKPAAFHRVSRTDATTAGDATSAPTPLEAAGLPDLGAVGDRWVGELKPGIYNL